jgi:hypothetical protein
LIKTESNVRVFFSFWLFEQFFFSFFKKKTNGSGKSNSSDTRQLVHTRSRMAPRDLPLMLECHDRCGETGRNKVNIKKIKIKIRANYVPKDTDDAIRDMHQPKARGRDPDIEDVKHELEPSLCACPGVKEKKMTRVVREKREGRENALMQSAKLRLTLGFVVFLPASQMEPLDFVRQATCLIK